MSVACFLALALGAATSTGGAGTIVVVPDVVVVSPARRWSDVSIRNAGSSAREVRLGVLEWSQGGAGGVVLEETDDASVFPARAVLAPGEVRRFRLSTTRPAPDVERAYRIWVAIRDLASSAGVVALVPAFVEPARRTAAPEVSVRCEAPRRCRVVVANRGTVRLRPDRISVAVLGGGVEEELRLDPWWVLAGGERTYDVELAARPASRREVVARVTVDGQELEARAETPD